MLNAVLVMLILGGLCGLFLSIAAKKFAVEVDERVEKVLEKLPGYNCGGCGYAGCSAMAEALVAGESKVDGCKPSKPDAKEEIKKILEQN